MNDISPIEKGRKAPSFSLPISLGGVFQLYSALANGPVVLNFIRGTWCQFCREHLSKIQAWKTVIDSTPNIHVSIVVISNESVGVLGQFQNENHIPFLFLSDRYGQVARNYGFRTEKDEYSRPAMVIVDMDGTIRSVDDGLQRSLKDAQEVCESCTPKSTAEKL